MAAGCMTFATRRVFSAMREGDPNLPIFPIGLICLGGLVLATCHLAESALAERVGQEYAAAVRSALFRHMSESAVHRNVDNRLGSMSLRFVGDLAALKGWITSGMARLISAAITIPTGLLALYLLEPALGLASTVPILLGISLIWWTGGPLKQAHWQLRMRRSRLAADLTERLPMAAALRQLGRHRIEQRNLKTLSRALTHAATHRALTVGLLRAIPDISGVVATASVLAVAIRASDASTADAAAALTGLALIMRPMRQLVGIWDRRQAWEVASERLDRVLATPRLLGRTRPSTASVGGQAEGPMLAIRNLRLSSGDTLTTHLQAGIWARLVGPAGSGKSYLLLMVAGLEPSPSHAVRVRGMRPVNTPPGEVLYLGPFSPMLKGSIRRNILMGATTPPSDEDLESLARRAGLGTALDRLGGLSAPVKERAVNLSHAERASLLVTRAIVADPRLLLVDADEIGLEGTQVRLLAEALKSRGCAAVIASRSESAKECCDIEVHLKGVANND